MAVNVICRMHAEIHSKEKFEMEKLRIGIIGCGGIANGKHMPALKKVAECEMVAFCDIVEERAQKAAAQYGVPGAKVTTDYLEIANDPDIDIVHVCTPNRSHSFISIACLEAGKHVMCEKPMAKTAAEAQAMLDAAKKSGKKLTIGYQNRQCYDQQMLKLAADQGKFGEIYFAKAHALRRRAVPTWGVFMNEYEQGGGPLIDIGTHALDLTLWTMNNYEPAMVVGSKFRKLADTKNAANAWGPWDPEKYTVEDSCFGFIKMKNGATIILESSWAINLTDTAEACCTIAGTKGGATTKGGLVFNGEENSALYTHRVEKCGGAAFYEGFSSDPSESDMRQWLNAIINDTEPCVRPEQALVVSQILEAIYTSSETGKPVFFD